MPVQKKVIAKTPTRSVQLQPEQLQSKQWQSEQWQPEQWQPEQWQTGSQPPAYHPLEQPRAGVTPPRLKRKVPPSTARRSQKTAPSPAAQLMRSTSRAVLHHGEQMLSKLSFVKELRPKRSTLGWSFFWIVALLTSGSIGIGGLLWLTLLPPLPNCEQTSLLAPDADRLYCAHEAARSGDIGQLTRAVTMIQDWPVDHPLYTEAQRFLKDWSEALMTAANQRIAQSDLQGAVKIAGTIPSKSPLYAQAQEAIATWKAQWQEGETIVKKAKAALREQNWAEASEQLRALGEVESEYWRTRKADELTQQIWSEKTAWQNVQQARKLVKRGGLENLSKAIALLAPIDRQTETWPQARLDLQQWSLQLLQVALKRWQAGDVEKAIALAQQVPSGMDLPGEAGELVQLGHAYQLAEGKAPEVSPSLAQSWRLLEAMAAVRQIAPESPFFTQAQTALRNWQAQIKDVNHLQWAGAIASLGQRNTFEIAIQQATQLGVERPRHAQAQALVERWTLEIQRMEDMPYLRRALQVAAPGTIPALQAAIAAAQQVPQRALWEEAQKAIATWQGQIETIEDQPILEKARQLANQRRWRDAISEARKIPEGRALSTQAQTLANQWQAEIDRIATAEDRRILDQAVAQANRGRLTAAINLAAQIGRGRPLHSEAASAIAGWQSERSAAWQGAQEAAPPEPTYSEPEPTYSEPEPEPEYSEPEPEPVYSEEESGDESAPAE